MFQSQWLQVKVMSVYHCEIRYFIMNLTFSFFLMHQLQNYMKKKQIIFFFSLWNQKQKKKKEQYDIFPYPFLPLRALKCKP